LTRTDLERIAGLDQHHRFVDGSFWELPNEPDRRATLWDEPVA
jgi:hypothetical protein